MMDNVTLLASAKMWKEWHEKCAYEVWMPPSLLCNTFGGRSCNVFYVSTCPLKFERVENKSWSGSISYIKIFI